MRYFFVCLLIFNIIYLSAQEQLTVSGTITDIKNGEHVVGATVYDSISKKATITNSYGFFSLSLPAGNVKLKYSTLGYQHGNINIKLAKDTFIRVAMEPAYTAIGEVTITDNSRQSIQTGFISMKASQIKNAPVLLGEADLLKTLQLLPGVKSGTEGTSGLYVRGGSPDQNLILLDGVPIYNSSHAFGFFSVFNPDAISSFTFYKGGMPARYAGRLSSVLDIKMKEGNNKKIEGKASLGLIASNFMLEGPVGGEKTSFFISGRRTFIDLLTKPLQIDGEESAFPAYFFYDLNAKVNHRFNDRNRLYVSIYSGKDHEGSSLEGASPDNLRTYTESDGFGWGNLTTSVRWNSLVSKKLFSNITLVYSKYEFSVNRASEEINHNTDQVSYDYSNYSSGIKGIGGRWDIDWFASSKHTIRTGVNFTHHVFNPGISVIKNLGEENAANIDTTLGNKDIYVREAFIYAEDEIKISDKLTANLGINYSVFSVPQKNYFSLQPRLALSYAATHNLTFKSSYGLMSQYLHLLTNSTTGLPTDLWLPVTPKIKPQNSSQLAVGIEYNLNNKYSCSLEGYYKKMENLVEYKEGASFFKITDGWEDKVEIGAGLSKGIELLVRKEQGRTTGWIGVTLSKTTRQFANISNGNEFPYRYDRRLDIGVLIMHKFSNRVSASCSWVFGTGNMVTLSTEKIRTFIGDSAEFKGRNTTYVKNVTGRNNFRAPAYHRMDVGIDFNKKKKHWSRTWSFGAYNVYNHKNPFFIYVDLLDNPPKLKQYSLFPILPYIKYSVSF